MHDVIQKQNCDRDKAFNQTQKAGPIEFSRRLAQIVN